MLLRAHDLKLPSWLVQEPSSSAGTTGCSKAVEGVEDKGNKEDEESNYVCDFSISEFVPKADSGEDMLQAVEYPSISQRIEHNFNPPFTLLFPLQ